MRNQALRFLRGGAMASAVFLVFAGSVRFADATVDLNGNGMSDVWESLFHAQGLAPNADADGDGMTNLQESIAGTDPFNANSVFKISKLDATGGNVTVHWPSVVGKRYQVFTSTDLTNWTPLTTLLVGTGAEMTTTAAQGVLPTFFRVTVSDIDTDADGVNDWEEIQVGLDPAKIATDGTNNDNNRVVAALQATSTTLTVSETDPVQSQDGMSAGTFTIARSGRLDPLTATYTVSGTAVAGTDYQSLSGTITFPFGFTPAVVQVTPLAGSTSTRTLLLNLTPGSGYQIGAPAGATMNIPPQPGASQVVQDIWTNVPGTLVSQIPLNTKPNSSRLLNTLENPIGAPLGTNYGTRIRGYFTAPTTGNYTFWIASADQSELWISDDDQPASLTKRASVTGATASHQWTKYPEQKSRLLGLTSGHKYYYEVYQKNGGSPENLAVGWLKPGQTGTAPSEVTGATASTVTPFLPVVHLPDGSALYFANLVPQTGVISTASGTATLQLAADETRAVLRLNYTNLSSGLTGEHIHGPADPGQSGSIIFDIDTAPPQQDGSFLWVFTQVGTYSPADIVSFIKAGRTYVNVHTANYPNGEIRGQLARTSGTSAFVAPTPPPVLSVGPASAQDAARFLTQATFGPTTALLGQVQSPGDFTTFLNQQFSMSPTPTLPRSDANVAALPAGTNPSNAQFQEAWWKTVLAAPDQLRQRVAFALSEILVVSANGNSMGNNPEAMAVYWDLLTTDVFGNFRQILEEVTLNPAMGDFLDMVHNDKPDLTKGTEPNENYAREINQLFSIGLNRLNLDGSLALDDKGQPVPTYDQNVVIGFAHVFTGWYWAQSGTPTWNFAPANYRLPMIAFATHHDAANQKFLLDNNVLPAGQTQAQDLKDALDIIFNHPNVGPFIARQLIQRLVTDNPSPGYIYRVAQVFNNNGQGVRGDMKAVIQSVLLDYEARTTAELATASYGHEREPLIRLTNLYRAFNASAASGNFAIGNQTSNFAQGSLYAPTVFNFFPPDYIQPGAMAQAGLFAPEFAITTDTTVITSANKMRSAVYQQPSGTNLDLMVCDLSSLTPLASNPGVLVDSLNNLLMNGEMSPSMRTIVVNAVTQISATKTLERAQTAVHLLVTSPEFVIEK